MNLSTHKPINSKTIWLIVIGIIIISIIIFIAIAHKQIGDYLTRKSTELLSKSLKAEIKAKDIKGNLFTGIAFSEVNIHFTSGDSFNAADVKAEYDLFSIIFKKEKNVKGIKIRRPIFHLYSKPSSTLNGPQEIKIKLPIALPLLLINRIEIENGSVFYDEKVKLDSFSIKAYLHLFSTGGNFLISKSTFILPDQQIKIQNLQGKINLSNNIITLQNITINSDKSSMNFAGKFNLEKNQINLEIKYGQIDLSDFTKNREFPSLKHRRSGQIKIVSNLTTNLNLQHWQMSKISGNLEYINSDIRFGEVALPDGNGTINFYDTLIKIKHTSNNLDNSSEININADFYIKNLFYQGNAIFANFQFPLSNLQFPLNGIMNFNGVGTDSLYLALFGSCENPKIESVSAQGFLRKGKLVIKKIRIKDGKSLLLLNGFGQLSAGKNSFIGNYEFSNFSLTFASNIYNTISSNHLILQGEINGTGSFSFLNNQLSSNGEITLSNSSIEEKFKSQLKHLSLHYDLSDIKQMQGEVKLDAESLFLNKTIIPKFNLTLLNSNFVINLHDPRDNRLFIQGRLHNFQNLDCTIDSFIILNHDYQFSNVNSFQLKYQDRHFFLKDFEMTIGNGHLKLDLLTNYASQPNINLQCNQINLELLSDILNFKQPLIGIINCHAHNAPDNNSYAISLSADNLKVPNELIHKSSKPGQNNSEIKLKHIQADFLFKEKDLTIDKISIVQNYDTSTISGKISFTHSNFMENPLNLDIVLADPGIWIFFFLKDIIDVRDGKLSGSGKINGTLNYPNLSGTINVSDAKIFIVPTRTSCEMVNGELVFDRQNIFIRNLNGKAETGKINADGYIHLTKISEIDTMSYQIQFQNAPMRFQKEVFAIATGNVNIDQQTSISTIIHKPLSIIGNIIIKEALLTPEFSSATSISSGSKTPPPQLNLKIIGERDIWLRNQLADIELSCDLNVTTIDENIIFAGQLSAIQGNLYYLDHTLKLSKGDIIFDNTTELNPTLDISAALETRPIKIQSDIAQRIKIILTLSGRLKEPDFTFTSDPPVLSNEDIMTYLAINVTWQEMTASELRETFTAAISDKLLGYFERELTKRLRGFVYLDYLYFESGLVGGTGAKVTVGKYIGPKLYFTYQYNISQTANDVFRLEYYMTRTHQIIGERDDDNRYNLKYQYKIRY